MQDDSGWSLLCRGAQEPSLIVEVDGDALDCGVADGVFATEVRHSLAGNDSELVWYATELNVV